MPWISRILVPIDFSAASLAALRYAAFLGEHNGAQVCLIHVGAAKKTRERQGLETSLRAFAQQAEHLHGDDADLRVVFGPVAKSIVAAAHKLHADLIVMGKTDESGSAASQHGNVIDAVAAASLCAVVPVHAPLAKQAEYVLGATAGGPTDAARAPLH